MIFLLYPTRETGVITGTLEVISGAIISRCRSRSDPLGRAIWDMHKERVAMYPFMSEYGCLSVRAVAFISMQVHYQVPKLRPGQTGKLFHFQIAYHRIAESLEKFQRVPPKQAIKRKNQLIVQFINKCRRRVCELYRRAAMRAFHILVADDDDDSRIALEATLRELGFSNIDQAPNGLEALKLLIRQQYDLIFLDNTMPVMTGLEFLRRCKCGPILDSTFVMFVTGSADNETVAAIRTESLKVDDLIIKPMNYSTVSSKVDRALRTSKSVTMRQLIRFANIPDNARRGIFLQMWTECRAGIAIITMFGFFLNDDRSLVKELPEAIAAMGESTVVLDLSNVLMIDAVGLGILLLINSAAQMAKKDFGIFIDQKTIGSRLMALGISAIIRFLDKIPELPKMPKHEELVIDGGSYKEIPGVETNEV